jgi:hypothetical protein
MIHSFIVTKKKVLPEEIATFDANSDIQKREEAPPQIVRALNKDLQKSPPTRWKGLRCLHRVPLSATS